MNIIRMIKSRAWVRWVGHVLLAWEKRNIYRVLMGNLREDHIEDLEVDGRIRLKWIINK
jgi:hypothetical protein